MELKNQLVSFKPSMKLKELGVKQGSEFYWDKSGVHIFWRPTVGNGEYSAFTVAELGKMLPFYLKEDAKMGVSFSTETCGLSIFRTGIGWSINYKHRSFHEKTEANARAKCLTYLIENKLITP